MRVVVDLNVVLDVVQRRRPHYRASARVLSRVRLGDVEGVLPAHGLTTIDYVVTRFAHRARAGAVVDWLLDHFEVEGVNKSGFRKARHLVRSGHMPDFEDAVVAVTATSARCSRIVTRNLADFEQSPVPACPPEALLAML